MSVGDTGEGAGCLASPRSKKELSDFRLLRNKIPSRFAEHPLGPRPVVCWIQLPSFREKLFAKS